MNGLGYHFFRREYGRLVAILSRRVGVQHLEAVEDAVQFALAAAVEAWPRSSVPENPSAWLWAAVLADLHRRAGHVALAERHRAVAVASAPPPAVRAALERRLRGPRGRRASPPETR